MLHFSNSDSNSIHLPPSFLSITINMPSSLSSILEPLLPSTMAPLFFSYHFKLLPLCFFFLTFFGSSMSLSQASTSLCKPDSGPVTPTASLLVFLDKVQEAAFNAFGSEKGFDPKQYVDLSLKQNSSVVQQAFNELLKSANGSLLDGDLRGFINEQFDAAGSDLVRHDPVDFVPKPKAFLPKVKNTEIRKWAFEVHALWKNLSRKVSNEVEKHPERHTLLPLSEPVIVPGSRFREVYYWDSYWVIRGLLTSRMYKTAKSIVTNLMSLVEKYGLVLNGARAYYTNRSQPPLLTAMVREIYKRTRDMELVKKALPLLIKEYRFWNSDIHKVTIQDGQGYNYTLNRYYAMWNKPRPESAPIDRSSASNISSPSEKELFYREVASTAESGWDFSTRWMRNSSEFTSMSTTSILPVDLNIYILGMELDISFMAQLVGEKKISQRFWEASQLRKKAINSIFWNEKKGQWLDYWLNTGPGCTETPKWKASNQNKNTFASNFVPLWNELFHSDTALVEKVMKSFKASGLLRANGIATSLSRSGQQWDLPNGWGPLQHMIVEGLARSGSQEARSLAEDIVTRWIRTNYVAFKQTGVMHEKYDVEKCGGFGGGGEYVSQTGFGWSNGVVLAFLEEFGWPEHRKTDC